MTTYPKLALKKTNVPLIKEEFIKTGIKNVEQDVEQDVEQVVEQKVRSFKIFEKRLDWTNVTKTLEKDWSMHSDSTQKTYKQLLGLLKGSIPELDPSKFCQEAR